MAKDIDFVLNTGGGDIPVTPTQLRNSGNILLIEVRKQMKVMANALITVLKRMYVEHDRTRVDGAPLLSHAVEAGLRSELEYIGADKLPELEMRFMDLQAIRDESTTEGYRGSISLFDLVEPGNNRVYRSLWYGFLPYDFAKELAEECIRRMRLSDSDAEEFRGYVADRFGGKHGEGIMVKLDIPLFMRYPTFGTALEHGVKPDGGFTAFNIFHDVMKNRVGGASDLYSIASREIAARIFEPVPMLLVAATWYLIVTSILMVGQYYLEKYFSKGISRQLTSKQLEALAKAQNETGHV